MTRTTNARIAGITFLLYIVFGITSVVIGRSTRGEGPAATLAAMAEHAAAVRINVVLGLITCFVALALGVSLYAITRDQDPDLAMLALACRVGEAVIGGIFLPFTLGLLALSKAGGAEAPDPGAASALTSFFLEARGWNPIITASFFAVGSTLFSWLLLRGRLIPTPLAWLGVFASVLLVVGLPLQIAGVLRGAVTQLMWIPMAAFEIPVGIWLIVKGVANPRERRPA